MKVVANLVGGTLAATLMSGCHLDELLRRPPDIPPKTCTANVYIYRIDPLTQ